jgi:tetratricopeptide (TPR) repeat protein
MAWARLKASSWVLAVTLLAVACAPDRGPLYSADMARADDALGRHDDRTASTSFDEAAHDAKLPRDADHARYLAARALEDAHDDKAALARYDIIARRRPSQAEAADATYRAALLRIASGDPAVGWSAMEEVVTRFPGSGVARPALHRLVAHAEEEGGPSATLEMLHRLDAEVGKTERGEEVAYEAALALIRLGRTVEARDALVKVASTWPYPNGLLFDDALFRASLLDEALGRYEAALADLKSLLAARESSWLVGSYERPRYDAAELRIAELYETRLHDDARARSALHTLYADFPTSLLRDKALFHEAELAAKDGDLAHRCDLLASLVHDFPDSRYVPCATERCPRLTAPDKSAAPKVCHAYIERQEAAEPR